MHGNHPATQYYLGTAQLDGGYIEEGVKNIAAALEADPANFDGSAQRRLSSGRASALLMSHPNPKGPACAFFDDKENTTMPGPAGGPVAPSTSSSVVVWDDIFGQDDDYGGNAAPRLRDLTASAEEVFEQLTTLSEDGASSFFYEAGSKPRSVSELCSFLRVSSRKVKAGTSSIFEPGPFSRQHSLSLRSMFLEYA